MSRPAVIPNLTDTALYQATAQLAEKYKAQRDELYAYLRDIAAHHEEWRKIWEIDDAEMSHYHEDRRNAALYAIHAVEHSL